MKIGKKVGDSVYIGYDAIRTAQSELLPEVVKRIRTHHHQLPVNFRVDIVCVERGKRIRYLELSDMGDAHPYVIKSRILEPEATSPDKEGRCNGQIYHRLDLMLNPEHRWYMFHKCVAEFEQKTGLLGLDTPRGIGYTHIWKAWVIQHMPWEQYEDHITELKRKCAPD